MLRLQKCQKSSQPFAPTFDLKLIVFEVVGEIMILSFLWHLQKLVPQNGQMNFFDYLYLEKQVRLLEHFE